MAMKSKARPHLIPISSNPSREPNDLQSMRSSRRSVNREAGRALEEWPVTLIVEHQAGAQASSHHLPAGSRIVVLPVLVIGQEDLREVLPQQVDSAQHASVSASKPDNVKTTVIAMERRMVAHSKPSRYVYESLILDSARHEVHANGHEIELTPKEFGLLEYFLRNPGYVLSRDALLNAVWEYDYYGTTRTVDVHVRRLKRKIPLLEPAIICVRSLGYKLRESLGSVF